MNYLKNINNKAEKVMSSGRIIFIAFTLIHSHHKYLQLFLTK